MLGSFRALSPVESRILADAGITGCRTEVDALDAAVRAAFGVSTPVEETGDDGDHPHGVWSSRTYRPAHLPPVRVLAAPSSEPDRRRAHTADTQRFWAEHVRLRAGDPVLMVTAPTYVPFQHCDALGTPRGAVRLRDRNGRGRPGTDRAGQAARADADPWADLQEIRSAIRSMRALHATLPAG